MKDTLAKIWFTLSSLLLVVIYFLYDKRGRTIRELKSQAALNQLGASLKSIEEKSKESDESYEKAKQEYLALKLRHAEFLKRYSRGNDEPKPPTA